MTATTTRAGDEELRRIAHELRTYNPAADEYKGEHIHKVWAREIEALLTALPPASTNRLTDKQILEVARSFPFPPWGIGSTRQNAIEFARAIIAATEGK